MAGLKFNTESESIDMELVVCRVCHIFGYLPTQVLNMTRAHFYMLVRHMDECEIERARLLAIAFHDPSKLFKTACAQAQKIDNSNPEDVAAVLRALNQ